MAASTAPAAGSASPAALHTRAERELDELGQALRRLLSSVRRMRGRHIDFGGHEITYAEFELLLELFEHGALPAGELAAVSALTPATVTGMVDRLVLCGYVERTRSESDRRVVACELSGAAHSELQARKAAKRERLQDALADVAAADLRAATRVLELLCAHFDECPAPAPERA